MISAIARPSSVPPVVAVGDDLDVRGQVVGRLGPRDARADRLIESDITPTATPVPVAPVARAAGARCAASPSETFAPGHAFTSGG